MVDPEPVRYPMVPESMEARVTGEDLNPTAGSRVLGEHIAYVFSHLSISLFRGQTT
jgi:hypothetical protein